MCGLAGFIGQQDTELLESMSLSLKHRGPDDSGVFVGKEINFAFCLEPDFENYQEGQIRYLLLSLKYLGKSRKSVIHEIKRVSKPGLRVYTNSKELPRVLDNLGIAIMSTSKGVMTNLKAKELGIGGEVLCYIW